MHAIICDRFQLIIQIVVVFSCFVVLQLVYGKRQIQMSCEWEFTYNSILQSVDSIMDYDDNLAGYFS